MVLVVLVAVAVVFTVVSSLVIELPASVLSQDKAFVCWLRLLALPRALRLCPKGSSPGPGTAPQRRIQATTTRSWDQHPQAGTGAHRHTAGHHCAAHGHRLLRRLAPASLKRWLHHRLVRGCDIHTRKSAHATGEEGRKGLHCKGGGSRPTAAVVCCTGKNTAHKYDLPQKFNTHV